MWRKKKTVRVNENQNENENENENKNENENENVNKIDDNVDTNNYFNIIDKTKSFEDQIETLKKWMICVNIGMRTIVMIIKS